jgi:nicotinate-nucleotide pyrophosphorylase (carboxylating)
MKMFDEYFQKNIEQFKEKMRKKIYQMYEDDVGTEDITTEALIRPMNIKAIIKAKENGILAGIFETHSLLEKLGVKVKELVKEGSEIKKGDIIMEIEGDATKIMQAERTVMNFLPRLSGIATLTNKLVNKTKAKVASTRKTCFSFSDKYAVQLGKGYTHRLGLFDQYLIKGNHIDIVKKELNCSRVEAIKECIKRAREHKSGIPIEIEVLNEEEAIAATKEKPEMIMFDNWKRPSDIKRVVEKLKDIGICFEASGGINPDNIEEFGNTGVHFVSLGYLTHSCKPLEMSLKILNE